MVLQIIAEKFDGSIIELTPNVYTKSVQVTIENPIKKIGIRINSNNYDDNFIISLKNDTLYKETKINTQKINSFSGELRQIKGLLTTSLLMTHQKVLG